MIRLILFIVLVLLVVLLIILLPVGLWFFLRSLIKRVQILKPHSGLLAALFIVISLCLQLMDCLKGRSGDEIYEAVFNAPKPDCVKIISYKDAQVPIMDNDIRLHFKTCPAEIKRILNLENYEQYIEQSGFCHLPGNDTAFDIRAIGDSICSFHRQHGGGATEIIMRLDSTEVYYYDVDF